MPEVNDFIKVDMYFEGTKGDPRRRRAQLSRQSGDHGMWFARMYRELSTPDGREPANSERAILDVWVFRPDLNGETYNYNDENPLAAECNLEVNGVSIRAGHARYEPAWGSTMFKFMAVPTAEEFNRIMYASSTFTCNVKFARALGGQLLSGRVSDMLTSSNAFLPNGIDLRLYRNSRQAGALRATIWGMPEDRMYVNAAINGEVVTFKQDDDDTTLYVCHISQNQVDRIRQNQP